MLKIIHFLLTISLSIPSLSQYSQPFDGLTKKEIKELLQDQNDEKVSKYISEYSNKKSTGIGLLLLSVSIAFFANSRKEIFGSKSRLRTLGASLITTSGILFISGILLLATADGAFKKSKEAYLNHELKHQTSAKFQYSKP